MIFNLINKAKHIFFNNSNSNLKATNAEDAIKELNTILQGAFIPREEGVTFEGDANTCVKSGIYRIGNTTNVAYGNGLLLVFAWLPNVVIQINTAYGPEYVAIRICWYSGWSNWYRIATEKIT